MKTKTKTSAAISTVVPVAIMTVGLVLFGIGSVSMYRTMTTPKPSAAVTASQLVFQAPRVYEHEPGVVLVKFKPDADQAATIAEVVSKPQRLYVDRFTGKRVDRTSATLRKNPGRYTLKSVAVVFQNSTSLFPRTDATRTVVERLVKRGTDARARATRGQLERWRIIRVNNNTVIPELVRRFQNNPGVEAAEPSYRYSVAQLKVPFRCPVEGCVGGGGPSVTPNDHYFTTDLQEPPVYSWGQGYPDQWGLKRLGMGDAWSQTVGSTDIIVAVPDTGIDATHPDLQGQLWRNTGEVPENGMDDDGNGFPDDVQGWNTTTNNGETADRFGHGTHVAGIIGASTDNAAGIAGIIWNVKLMAVKSIDDYGNGTATGGANAIIYAANNGADVINMSWGGPSSQIISDALDYADSLGVILIASAGNSNKPVSNYAPANHPKAISVSAWCPPYLGLYDEWGDQVCQPLADGSRAGFSNFGNAISVTAPGVDVLSLRASGSDMYGDGRHIVGDAYYRSNGTSMSAPHVAGVAALLRAVNPSASPELIRAAIEDTAVDVLDQGIDQFSGHGMLNAKLAVQRMLSWKGRQLAELLIPASASATVSGQRFRVHFEVLNVGNAIASNIGYRIHQGGTVQGQVLAEGQIAALEIGGRVTLDVDLDLSSGNVLTIVIDESQSIPELTDRNNSRAVDVSLLLPGFPVQLDYFDVLSSPSLADLDGDGKLEILVGAPHDPNLQSNGYYIVRDDGTFYPGWPQITGGYSDASPIVVDHNGDGSLDIVAGAGPPTFDRPANGSIYAWNRDGTLLSGWPRQVDSSRYSSPYSSPAVTDLDDDGRSEVIATSYGVKIYVWGYDGRGVPGWPWVNDWYQSSPVVGDLDQDGQREIIAASRSRVAIWRHNGTVFPGWPKSVSNSDPYDWWETSPTPAIADLDGDGRMDVIASTRSGMVYAWNAAGAALPGWPQSTGEYLASSAGAADLDGDGRLEVVAATATIVDPNAGTTTGQLIAWRNDGTVMPGWPVRLDGAIYSSPAFADLDGDGRLEIVVGTYAADGKAYAFHADGSLVAGWPQTVRNFYSWVGPAIMSSAAIGDINNDGRLDVVIGSAMDSSLYAWTIPSPVVVDRQPWPTFHHDNQRTGRFDTTPPTVLFLQPQAETTVATSTTLIARATDNTSIRRLEFFRDGVLIGTGTKVCKPLLNGQPMCTYSVQWDITIVSDGPHTLTARATDVYSNQTSTSISVIVTKPIGGVGGGPRKFPE